VTYDSDKSVMTPDGRYVAIAYTHVDDKGAFPPNRVLLWDRVLPKDPAVEIYHRPGGEMQTWQFTPDGQRLYVAYWTADADNPAGRYGADVVDLRTKTTQPVTLPTDTTTAGKSETMYFATTTADGKLYLVVDGGGALHVASSAGKLIRRLTAENTRVNPWRVQLSPDGRQVACVARHVDNSQQLFVVDFSGGESRELVPASVVTDLRAHWSPDGKRLAYSSRSFAPANPPFHFGTIAELKLVDPDGQNPVTLVTEKVHPNGASLELIGWR
jgi:dipeptidyl aminopeptidase/acylaminoacyl peptidase